MGEAALESLRALPVHRWRTGVLVRALPYIGYGGAAGGFALAVFFRFWHLNAVGYNSDEAVYAGQARALAHDPQVVQLFPVFRAHPLLFQTILSIGYRLGGGGAWRPARGYPGGAQPSVGSVAYAMEIAGPERALVVWTVDFGPEVGVWAAFLE